MRQADLIVCERRDRLTHTLRSALLRRGIDRAELTGRKTWLRQRSGMAAVRSLLAELPASLVVLETTPGNLKEVLRLLVELPMLWPAARAVAAIDETTAPCRSGLREAGAIHVVQELWELDAVADMALAHFARQPKPVLTLKQEIWEALPWTP
jgi:hypothetical protein